MKPRNEIPPLAFVLPRELATCSTLASACSPLGRQHEAHVRAGVRSSRRAMVSATGGSCAAMELLQQAKGARIGNGWTVGSASSGQLLIRSCRRARLRDAERDGTCRSDGRILEQQSRRSIAKSEPLSVAKTASSSSGISIGGQRGANRFDFLAIVERLAPDEQVRDAARVDGLDVRPASCPRTSS
jgi:hypothetical protein